MSETQHGDQIEQDQISQSERAYERRAGLCRLRGHKPGKRDKINYSEFNREMIDEMTDDYQMVMHSAPRCSKTMLPVEAISAITPNRARSRALRIAD